ncbi:hypothetical protein BC941DRAFT_438167, partial [Chlamydoabsidia padenii]
MISIKLWILFITYQWISIVSARFDISCEHDPQVYPEWITPSPCYQQPFQDVYIFGDSYSDNGQPLRNWKYYQTHTFPDRHSNGPMCIEYFTKMLGANLYEYAYSGATVDNTIVYRNTMDIHQQLAAFQQKGDPSKVPETTLYTFWIGTNDVADIFKMVKSGAQRDDTIVRTVASLYNALETLYHMPFFKVKHILIMGLLPIDHMPVISNLITLESQRAPMTELVSKYNRGLEALVRQFNREHPDAQVYFYNPQKLADRLMNHSVFDTTTPCLIQTSICSDENRRLWWDDWHPTTVTSYMVAKDLYQALLGMH